MIRQPQFPQIELSLPRSSQRLFVDADSFFEFSFWISEELLDLEATFKEKHRGRLAGPTVQEELV